MTELLIGTPSKSGFIWGQTAKAVSHLFAQCERAGIAVQWGTIYNDPYVFCARDAIANRFLDDTKATHLMFIDDDIVFNPADVFKLIEADKSIIGGVYPMKKIDWELVQSLAGKYGGNMLNHVSSPCYFWLPKGQETILSADIGKPTEVMAMGTGFMLIRRDALEKFRAHYQLTYLNKRYSGKNLTPFFYMGIEAQLRESIGEDVQFCFKMREMGEKVYVLPSLTLGHVGFQVHWGCIFCSTGEPIHHEHKGDKA